ncbi:type II toxin-antitoxin system RelB family antitoxin [Loigolactobacillus zhaoyuanensis]|uniref:Type II toxin-antitoxin system RelB family antitoxin n=1 Tax=Loigolactobacillus zhaoyuanensis TaxID=2486017 RepID=A0ABW8UC19_9LACO|nr:DUF6290 family protein [Loigolactobacillus zhaoyuanensis]
MPVTSLRFKDDQYNEIKEMAAFYGVSVTTFMRKTILERLEDEQDYQDAVDSIDSSDGKLVSRLEMLERFNSNS